MSADMIGVPMPVAMSYPGVAGYTPLLSGNCPEPVMSWKYRLASLLNSE